MNIAISNVSTTAPLASGDLQAGDANRNDFSAAVAQHSSSQVDPNGFDGAQLEALVKAGGNQAQLAQWQQQNEAAAGGGQSSAIGGASAPASPTPSVAAAPGSASADPTTAPASPSSTPATTAPATPDLSGSDDGGAGSVFTSLNKVLSQDDGLNTTQIAAVDGNIEEESGGNSDEIQGGTEGAPPANNADDNQNGYGAAQFGGVRKEGLEQYAESHNLYAGSVAANVGYIQQELTSPGNTTLADLKGGTSLDQDTQIFAQDYEKPSDPNMATRDQDANQAFAELNAGQAVT